MRTSNFIVLMASPLALAACGGEPTQKHGSMDEHDTSTMNEGDTAKTADAVGTVTAIDADAGTITVDHEPVAELGWPQMVMAFDATEEVRGDVTVGDAIGFTIEATDEGNTITAMAKQ